MKKVILLSVSILLISLAYSFAEVPCKINYQGRLIKDNVPVDGTKTMRFSIYDSAVGPTLLWTSGNVSVEVHNGLFRYVIGSGGTDLSGMDWTAGQALYLEVVIDGEILTPREELSAYPYAINSHLLEGQAKEYFLNASAETQTKQGNLNIMGNLGIGTTGPNDKLEISNGAVRFGVGNYKTGSVEKGRIFIDNSQTISGFSNDAWIFEKSDGNSTNPDSPIAFVTVGSDDVVNPRLVIQGSGNVGIGTTSPDANLEVDNTLCLTPTDSPDHAVEGAIHYDDSEAIVKYHDGTGWKTIGPKIYSVIGTDNISTTSTTWTDMKDMSITENFPAGKLFITFNAEFYRGQWPEMGARIVVDNVEKAKILLPYDGSSYLRHRIMHVEAVSTVTEGPHTVKVQWKTTASTLQQLGASKGQRILTVIQGN